MARAAAPSEYRASPLAVWSALIVVYLVWGSTYLAIRYAVETTPPFLMAAVRFIISGGFLYLARRAAGDPPPTLQQWRSAAIIGVFLLVGGNGGVVWAEQFVPSSRAALLVATVPLWIVLLEALRSRSQRPTFLTAAGILMGFGGVVLLVGNPAGATARMSLYGEAVLIFASLSWATGSLYSKNAPLPQSQLLGTGMEMLCGGVALLLLACLGGELHDFHLAAASQRSLIALVYLIVFGSCGFAAYVWLLRVAPTPLVATYAYVNPLVAVILGYALAHEPLTMRTVIAAAFIIGSVVLVSVTQR